MGDTHDAVGGQVEARLRSVIEHMPVAYILWDAEQRVVDWNPAAERIFGWKRREVLGQQAGDMINAPEAKAQVEEIIRRLWEGELDSFDGRGNNIRKDGSQISCQWHNAPLKDEGGHVVGCISMVVDVTEDIRTHEELMSTYAKLDAVVQNTDEKILLSDKNAMPLFFNRAYAQAMKDLLGLEMRPGFQPHTLLPKEQQEIWDEYHRRVLGGESFVEEFLHEAASGEVFAFEVSYKPIVVAEEVTGFSEITRDITERKHQEEERRLFQERIMQAQKLESLGVLAGGVAHDFNNLLLAVLGNAELMLVSLSEDDALRQNVLGIQEAASRAAQLSARMLEYSGRGPRRAKPENVSELVRRLEGLLSAAVPKKVQIVMDLAGDLPPIAADAAQVGQVVTNLVTNAGDAIGNRAGTIRVTTDVVEIDHDYLRDTCVEDELSPGRYVRLVVSDDGAGMDVATVQRIFEPFFSTKFTGRGLGLAATLGIVRAHGGAIRVESTLGEGTTFEVVFAAGAGEMSRASPTPVPLADGWSGTGIVLLADDDDGVRKSVKAMIESIGFSVMEARDGAEAVTLYRAYADSLAAVLLDSRMPVLSGEEALAEIRLIRHDAPVVLSSGYAADQIASPLDRQVTFVQKPYGLTDLRRALRKVVGMD